MGPRATAFGRLRDLFTAAAAATHRLRDQRDQMFTFQSVKASRYRVGPNERRRDAVTSRRSARPSYLDLKAERLVVLFLQDHDLPGIKNSSSHQSLFLLQNRD